MMQPTPGRREMKKARTRVALVEAALELFRERGFEDTTIDDIAARAEVSRRTFFRYFPTKEMVVFPERETRLDAFRAMLLAAPEAEPAFETIRRACRTMSSVYAQSIPELIAQQQLIDACPALINYQRELDLEWQQEIEAHLRRRQTPERPAWEPRLLAAAIMGIVRASLQDWIASGCENDLVAFADKAFDMLWHGAQGNRATLPPSPA